MSEVHRYQVVTMLSVAGATIGYDPHGPDVVMAAEFDRVTAERDALQQRLTAADERADALEQALKFYADREHYHFESGNWDTVSGEPLNILWNGDEPDFIEDGSVARAALKPAEPAKDEHVCDGCGSKGWMANCKECVPY